MKETALKVINHYGVMPQLKYFQSEVFELNEAIIQKEYPAISKDNKPNELQEFEKQHITEELSDVMFMLKQFQVYYEITDEAIEKVMIFKGKRQLKRMEEEK